MLQASWTFKLDSQTSPVRLRDGSTRRYGFDGGMACRYCVRGTLARIPSAWMQEIRVRAQTADARRPLSNLRWQCNLGSCSCPCPGYTAGPSELDDDEPAALRENEFETTCRCTEYHHLPSLMHFLRNSPSIHSHHYSTPYPSGEILSFLKF